MRRPPLRLTALLAAAACASAGGTPPSTPRHATKVADGPAAPTERTPAQFRRDAELAARAAAVVDAFQNRIPGGFAGQLTHDGRGLVFGSNRDGSPQLYLGDAANPGAPPRRLSEGAERVETAALTRDGGWVLFTRDRGADENSHIYRVALDGSATIDLTPGEGFRNEPPLLPLRRPDLMIYGRRKTTSPASTLLAQPIAGGAARAFYEDPAPAFAADAAPDGSRALVLRYVSASEQVLLEVDLASSRARRLWPAEGRKEAISAAVYAADGRTAFIATDQGGEASALLALDLGTLAVTARWSPDPATASLDQALASPRGDLVAVRVNAGNRIEVRLLDAAGLRERARPALPLGSAELGEFTPDGRALTIALATPDHPGEPFALDVETGALRALRADPRPGGAALAAVDTAVASIPAFDGKPIPVHTYLPKDWRGERLPVIVEFHGGPSASSVIGWKTRAQFFVGLGYAWVEPNMRGSTGFGRAWEMADNREKRGDVLLDMASVRAWVAAQPWADGRRIVLFGGSYGGWVVLMGLTRQQPLWSAGIDLVGVADLRTLLRTTDQAIRAVFVDEFGDLEKDEALLAAYSPLRDAAKISVPLFVYQGQNDPRVPRSESDAIVGALRARGLPVEYMIAANEGHSLDRRDSQVEFFSRSARFLEEHLANPAR